MAMPHGELRPLLLETHGIGPETADAIVLYAAGRPSFVVDAYTGRTFTRLGFSPAEGSYEGWRRMFMDSLPADPSLFNEYHALIVRHGKDVCRKVPVCRLCPLSDMCPTGSAHAGRTEATECR
jgi:endonuclease-3 related protein